MDKEIKEFKKNSEEILQKSQEDFEKQLSFISAGTLGISMFLIEKVIKDLSSANHKWTIIFSWCLLGFTLVGNLVSHFLAVQFNYRNIKEIDTDSYSQEKSKCRNNIIQGFNIATLGTLLIGIIFLIIFLSINI
jgi:hypothetical protein